MTQNQTLASALLAVQQATANEVCSRSAHRLLLLDKRIQHAIAELTAMIDGGDECRGRDSEISHIIRILEREAV